MKKIGISLFGVMALSGLGWAGDVYTSNGFVGLEVSGTRLQADTAGFYQETNYEGENVEFGIRIGAQNEEWRTMFVFNYFDSSDDNQNYEKGLFELDYFLTSGNPGEVTFQPFIGVNVGYMNYESDGEGLTSNISESGFLYGGQAGISINFSEAVNLDVMYRYSLTDFDHTDHIESVVVGLNYSF